jgi:hypothetical protein
MTEDSGFIEIFRCNGIDLDNSESEYDDPWFFTVDLIDASEKHVLMNKLLNKKVKITIEILDD